MPKCSLCGRGNAVYMRPYSGERLCTRCFCQSIEDKVRVTIANYDMLRYNDRIAVGVSGGKDSVSLLHILAKLEKSFPESNLTALTIDEGILGYRDEALRIARKNCKKLAVNHIVVSFKELFGYNLDQLVKKLCVDRKSRGGLTPCAYCGVLRRRALNSVARDCGATKLATAHNLDDEAQTILLNILHGDPLRIARGGPVSPNSSSGFVCRIKPFCRVLEKETAMYAYLEKIDFQNVPCPYASEALRNDVRTMLNRMEDKHPGVKHTVCRSAEKLWASLERGVKAEKPENCEVCGEPTANKVCQPCKMLQDLAI